MTNDDNRFQLALSLVRTLPRWGTWVQAMRDVQTPWGQIGFRQATIMWMLRTGTIPPAQRTTTGLAAVLRIQNSVISRACDRLEHLGLIERTVSPDDRRRSTLTLTENGIKASTFIEDLYVGSIVGAMSGLDASDIANLEDALATLEQIGDKLFHAPPGATGS